MAMSHANRHLFIHLIWATKNTSPLIAEEIQSPLLGYISGIVKNLGGLLLATSGTSNHVHLLINISTHLSIAEFISQLKCCSSKWYREKYPNTETFGWNPGYLAFTVSPTSLNDVKIYFNSEKERHEKLSLEEEITRFLKLHQIEFKPEYITNTTYTKLVYHLVWSVKNREQMLIPSMRIPLHQLMAQQVSDCGGKLHAVGNVADHAHLLLECNTKISIGSLVQILKTSSTHMINSQANGFVKFSWQDGYGAFSVGRPAFEATRNYVNNQEKHHQTIGFDEEWQWLHNMNVMFR